MTTVTTCHRLRRLRQRSERAHSFSSHFPLSLNRIPGFLLVLGGVAHVCGALIFACISLLLHPFSLSLQPSHEVCSWASPPKHLAHHYSPGEQGLAPAHFVTRTFGHALLASMALSGMQECAPARRYLRCLKMLCARCFFRKFLPISFFPLTLGLLPPLQPVEDHPMMRGMRSLSSVLARKVEDDY